MIPLFRSAVAADAADRVRAVLDSGYLGQGPRVAEFEAALAQRLGTDRLATVNSATSGLHLALHLLAGPPGPATVGGEVLTTPLTFPATNWPILALGLRPRWVDVDPATLNIDLTDLAAKITARTRAIMVVHWGGYPVDLDRLREVVDEAGRRTGHRPPVIEDCAHAWGSSLRGRPLGDHGNTAVFSFQAIKHLTTGDGGLVVLPDDVLCRRARRLRWLGLDRDSDESFRSSQDVTEWGYKFHLNDVAAAIGLANLDTVDARVDRHRANAAWYADQLRGVAGLDLLERRPDRRSAEWIFTVKVDDRPGFIRRLGEAGIAASPVQRRNDLHSCVHEFRTDLPGLDAVADRMVAIPVGWWVDDDDRSRIAEVIRAGW
ncbi:DegT/DnrJ/EryC1/StrS family aminotransferase [Micromonospora sp. AMSO1212t]|uniref:DegT/DnrJ/EryC1/StrS family aminotransferase n=1 Tax=Micromonospora sp. AMSO1212t TaxID=2650565 RepID=UPI00124B972B|nr:DegT/DnrJ/EryC1/StrS family aminotransferase [Micromonospora sp. AMSO1212t]KAB1910359.1 DegT/DnrJ/EryC1/StrS family aminotransferase [Micromonospora sp. AMSO1212t]